MFRADYHAHSRFSFDADPDATMEVILNTAAAKGLNEIAVCDHYDVNHVLTGGNPDIDFSESRRQITAANEKNKTNTKILLGIELGQPNQFPDKAREVLESADFDFVLCALHNARDDADFYFVDYKNTDMQTLTAMYERYTGELCELADWGEFHALAHITYPIRYFMLNNIDFPVRKYYDLYIKLFKILIHRGIALEVNASGLRKPVKQPSPSYELLELYKNTGGELVTAGSDAHRPHEIASGIDAVYARLAELGFKYITAVKNKKLIQVKFL